MMPFGTAHRAHASNVGISINVEKAVQFPFEIRITYIQEAVIVTQFVVIAICGGSGVSDKIGVIKNLLEKADKVQHLGGGMTYTFYKAQGVNRKLLGGRTKLDVERIA